MPRSCSGSVMAALAQVKPPSDLSRCTLASGPKYLQVRGEAVVAAGGGGSKATVFWLQERSTGSFTTVPPNTRLIITDFLYVPQTDMSSNHVINVAEWIAGGDTIVLQLFVHPKVHTQAHFLTGFVIAPGSSVTAFSDAGGHAGQHVSITLVGYLAHPLG